MLRHSTRALHVTILARFLHKVLNSLYISAVTSLVNGPDNMSTQAHHHTIQS